MRLQNWPTPDDHLIIAVGSVCDLTSHASMPVAPVRHLEVEYSCAPPGGGTRRRMHAPMKDAAESGDCSCSHAVVGAPIQIGKRLAAAAVLLLLRVVVPLLLLLLVQDSVADVRLLSTTGAGLLILQQDSHKYSAEQPATMPATGLWLSA